MFSFTFTFSYSFLSVFFVVLVLSLPPCPIDTENFKITECTLNDYCEIRQRKKGIILYGGKNSEGIELWSMVAFYRDHPPVLHGRSLDIKCDSNLGGNLFNIRVSEPTNGNIDVIKHKNEDIGCYIVEGYDSRIPKPDSKSWDRKHEIEEKKENFLNSKYNDKKPHLARFGHDGRYIFRMFDHSIHCYPHLDGFGDKKQLINAHIGSHKVHAQYCSENKNEPIDFEHDLWIKCNEKNYNECVTQDLSKDFVWVRFGFDNVYNYRKLHSSNGKIDCTPAVFGFPGNNLEKKKYENAYKDNKTECSYYPSLPYFEIKGEWELASYCANCIQSPNYEITVGTTFTDTKEKKNINTQSIQSTISAGYMDNIGVSVTGSLTHSQQLLIQNTLQLSDSVLLKFQCKETNPFLYQRVYSLSQYQDGNQISANVRTPIVFCSQSYMEPRCPPGLCSKDDLHNCHKCIEDADLNNKSPTTTTETTKGKEKKPFKQSHV